MNTPNIRFKGYADDWVQRKLGDIATSFDYGLNAAAKEYDGTNAYIRITDIDDDSHSFISDGITSPDTDLSKADDYKVAEGDILFARTGASVGKSYIYKPSDGLMYFAGFLIRARVKPEYDAQFVFQNTLTEMYSKYIAVTSQRSGQPGVNAQEYAEYEIMCPTREEQIKIGEHFKNLDNLIALQQRKCDDLQEVKKYMLQKLFPQNGAKIPEIRFAGFTGEWEQRKLGELVEKVTRKNTNLESELPLTISAQYGLIDQNEFFDKRIASRDVSGYYLVYNGEFAYNKSTSNDAPWGAIKRLDRYEKGVLSTLYIVFAIKDKEKTDTDYLSTYYDNTLWHKEVYAIAAEGARNHGLLNITSADFFETKLVIPKSVDEQRRISRYFKELDNLIALQQRKCDDLKEAKRYMLQNMFPQGK